MSAFFTFLPNLGIKEYGIVKNILVKQHHADSGMDLAGRVTVRRTFSTSLYILKAVAE